MDIVNLKKYLKTSVFFFIMATLTGCPGEEDCNDLASDITVPDLVTIIPLQETYQKNDEIILSLTIPSENNYFGNTVDLFQETGDLNPLIYGDNNFFIENEVTILKGSQGEYANQFHLDIINNIYVLEVMITLNRVGNYSHDADYEINFQGNTTCNRYHIETTIQGQNSQNKIEFEVIE